VDGPEALATLAMMVSKPQIVSSAKIETAIYKLAGNPGLGHLREDLADARRSDLETKSENDRAKRRE
jgi:hypothetical protein